MGEAEAVVVCEWWKAVQMAWVEVAASAAPLADTVVDAAAASEEGRRSSCQDSGQDFR